LRPVAHTSYRAFNAGIKPERSASSDALDEGRYSTDWPLKLLIEAGCDPPPTSRLSYQTKVTDAFDGPIVRLLPRQV